MTPPPQVPYIGSTISLLSKASIRYEGFLYTIDQKESSVALSHVKVFGTEDRHCDRSVPPSDEIFEFIIFRASDITELKVIDTPPVRSVPDPAIIRAQNKAPPPPTSGSDQSGSAAGEANASVKNFLSQAGPAVAGVGGRMSAALPVGGGSGGSSGSGGGGGGGASSSSNAIRLMGASDSYSGRQSNRPQQQQQQQPQQQSRQHQSRSQQPPLMQGQQPQQQQQQQYQRRYNNQQQDNKQFSGGDYQQSSRSYYNNRRNNSEFYDMPSNNGGGYNGRMGGRSGGGGGGGGGYGYGPQGPPPLQSLQPMPPPSHYRSNYGGPAYSGYHHQQQQQHHPGYGYTMAPPPMMQLPPVSQRRYGGRPVMHFRRYPGAPNGIVGVRMNGGGRSGLSNQHGGANGWNSGSDYRRQQHQQQQQQHQQQQHQHHRQPLVDPIPARFTADYDFETANAEMEAELAKLVLGGGGNSGSANDNSVPDASVDQGDAEVDSKAHLAGTIAAVESLMRCAHAGYNKEKSFFDDISRVEADDANAATASSNNCGVIGGSGGGSGGNIASNNGPGGPRKETVRQNALNKETFGLVGGRMRRGIGNRFYGNRGPQRRALV